jgi:hypothetical protein
MALDRGKVGLYFLIIGIVLLVLFFVTGQENDPNVLYFFSGFGLSLLGFFLIRKNWKAPPPSTRFRMFRRKKKEEKKAEEYRD